MTTIRALRVIMALAMIMGLAAFGLRPSAVSASSHREAPNIIQDPTADNTDVYAFVSPDKPDTVTIVANFIPFEHSGNGPNFYQFDDGVQYAINIDNVGDAQAHITYQFRFTTQYTKPEISDYNDVVIDNIDSPNLNVKQRYTVTRLDNGKATTLGQDMLTPPYNVGVKSTPNYEALSNAGIHDLSDGSKVFAGPADDPFFLDFSIFDMLTVRKLPGSAGGGIDTIKGFNVHSIALQVPMTKLTANGAKPAAATDANAVIGVWSTTSRQTTRVLQAGGKRATGSGDFIQISRLGSPLVNEAVIPSGMKDLFNNSKPSDDGQFLSFVTDPSLAKALKKIYNVQVPPAPRDDLVAIFLTGIKGATMPPNVTPGEELRLNMGVPPNANPNRLGVLGGDMAGFPDGRRLTDDVFDIEVQGVAGAAYPLFHPDFKPDPLASQLGDGVDTNDVPFRPAFPYLALAHCATDCEGGALAVNLAGEGGQAVAQPPSAPPAAQPPVAPPVAQPPAAQPPSAPPVAPPAAMPPGSQPGMPRTGGAQFFQIDHLADIYGIILGSIVGFAGLMLLSGWTLRRKNVGIKKEE